MLPYSTVAGTHFVAAVAIVYTFPAAVGIVVLGVAALAPFGTHYSPAVVVVVAAAAFVAAIAAAVATVAAVVGWVVPGAVVDGATRWNRSRHGMDHDKEHGSVCCTS